MKRSYIGILLTAMLIIVSVFGSRATQTFAATSLPCDIYAAGGTPCVAAHSTTRALFAAYSGKLYQIQRASDQATTDIGTLSAGGYANAAAQDSFCSGTSCIITIIYDQTSNHNDLPIEGPGAAGPQNHGANASIMKLTAAGHTVYGMWSDGQTAYRNNAPRGTATGSQPEGTYSVFSGTHYNNQCCFDYGNTETVNADTGNGHMDAIYFGNATWFQPSGPGPAWVGADLENGMFWGGNGCNPNNTGINATFVTAMTKNDGQTTYAIKGGSANSGGLITWYNGSLPTQGGYIPMHKEGGIVLGSGGDNSNGDTGAWLEGAMTSGYPSDATEDAIQANIVSVGYTLVSAPAPTATPPIAPSPTPGTIGGLVKLNAGGPAVGSFQGDADYDLGMVSGTSSNIDTSGVTNPAPMAVYQTERWFGCTMTYTIPGLTAGANYTVRLHFAETFFTATGQRVFNVAINGNQVLTDFDIFQAAGSANKAVVKEFVTTANASGKIAIAFLQGKANNPKVNGIEILQASGPTPTPVTPVPTNTSVPTFVPPTATQGTGGTVVKAINAGGSATGTYVADTNFDVGNQFSDTSTSIDTSADPNPAPQAVYQTVRWNTAFTYTIPGLTASATYTVRLHWAELTWQAAGARKFNVAINGSTVLSAFDVFAAGGYKKAVARSFTTTANASGQIVIAFSQGGADNPFISGIEIVSSGSSTTPTFVPPTVTPNPGQDGQPWNGTPASLPGKVEAENYNTGGEGIAYHDADTNNQGGQYRTTEGVDVETTSDTGGGYNVGWTNAGEWMKYTVNVSTAGAYNIDFRVASPNTGSVFHLEVDGTNVTGTMTVPNTGGWQTYQTITRTGVSLSAGQHVLRFYEESGGFNLNWLSVNSGQSATATPVPTNTSVPPTNTPVPPTATTAPSRTNTPQPTATQGVGTVVKAINAGGSATGSYVADTNFDVGNQYSDTSTSIDMSADPNPAPQGVYQTVRWNTAFTYTIPGLTAGATYTVRLHWAELTWQTAGARKFNVAINGSTVLSAFDVFAAGGYKKAVARSFTATANASGQIVIAFSQGGADNPFISGIEIVSSGSSTTPTFVPPSVTPNPGQDGQPWNGTPASLPGKVEAENYNTGGEGIAYHDNDTNNQGGQYRTSEGVDVETTSDTGGGYNVGWTNAGEWMKYTVNVTTAGAYNLDFRVASPNTGSVFHLEVDGTNVTGTMTVPNTGGWQTFQTVTKTGVSLSAGQHVLRFYEESGGFNLNWLNLSIPAG